MVKRRNWTIAVLFIASAATAATNPKQETAFEAGRRAYEASDYVRAIEELQVAAAKDQQNGDVQLLLTKSYLELPEHDPAIKSAERAVAIDAQNSVYHEWLGRAYGEKADHANPFSAMSLAKKSRKEFEVAVELDAKPARAVAGGRGYGRACGAGRPAGGVLQGCCADFEEGEPRGSRAITGGLHEESADAIGISAAGGGTGVVRATLRRPKQDGRRGEGI